MTQKGFTLLELMLSMSILSVVGLLGFVAVQASSQSAMVADSAATVQAEVRNVMQAITAELPTAAKRADDSLDPVLQATEVVANPVTGSPIELAFQIPTDGTARMWSRRIRYRFVNEDTNGDARLNPGEDTDRNGVLTRRLVRIQDRNGDGDTRDPGELVALGGANNLSAVAFQRDGSNVVVSLTATKLVGKRRSQPITATVTGRVYLQN